MSSQILSPECSIAHIMSHVILLPVSRAALVPCTCVLPDAEMFAVQVTTDGSAGRSAGSSAKTTKKTNGYITLLPY